MHRIHTISVVNKYFSPKLSTIKGLSSSNRQIAAKENIQWLSKKTEEKIVCTRSLEAVAPRLPTLAVIP